MTAIYVMAAGADAGVQPFEQVSLVRLIARPESYDGRVVQVVGYGAFDYEGTALFLQPQDYEHGVPGNKVWLSLGARWKDRRGAQPRYVIVRGVFRAGDLGHMGLSSGSLENIELLEDWGLSATPVEPAPKEPRAIGCSR